MTWMQRGAHRSTGHAGTHTTATLRKSDPFGRSGHVAVIQLLLARGAEVNVLDTSRRSPLDWALGGHRPDAAALLKEKGGLEGWELDRRLAMQVQDQLARKGYVCCDGVFVTV
jgi:hypothetical protein